ncbi:hypothetical protein V5F89_01945 [Pelagerythrobacter marensis]|uniref:Uncharacterized protein n=1 Tax=Pelagerythrobacter marensis TaxID=543877 RepID=A0ABZ2D3S4_9SPHN
MVGVPLEQFTAENGDYRDAQVNTTLVERHWPFVAPALRSARQAARGARRATFSPLDR